MKRSVLLIVFSSFFIVGCFVQKLPILSTYDRSEIEWSMKQGTGKIEGSGFLFRNDGMLVKCAGKKVSLIPFGTHSEERFTKLYGSPNGGFNSHRNVDDSVPQYYADHRTTVCDVDGKFSFENVPAGKYYITTIVQWYIEYIYQGGSISQLIQVEEGKTLKVVLTG